MALCTILLVKFACYMYTGVDFTTLTLPLEIDFSPDEQNIFIPVSIIEDDILEAVEQFQLILAVPTNAPPYSLETTFTIVSILDNEGESDYVSSACLMEIIIISIPYGNTTDSCL